MSVHILNIAKNPANKKSSAGYFRAVDEGRRAMRATEFGYKAFPMRVIGKKVKTARAGKGTQRQYRPYKIIWPVAKIRKSRKRHIVRKALRGIKPRLIALAKQHQYTEEGVIAFLTTGGAIMTQHLRAKTPSRTGRLRRSFRIRREF